MPSIRLASVCLFSLFLAVSVQAQGRSLSDAKTVADCWSYITQEIYRFDLNNLGTKKRAVALADVYTAAGERIMELAETPSEKLQAYHAKLHAFMLLIEADVEGAEQKLETFLKEVYTDDVRRAGGRLEGIIGSRIFALRSFALRPQYYKKIAKEDATPENFEKIKSDMEMDIKGWGINVFDAMPFWLQVAEQHNVSGEQLLDELIGRIQPSEGVEGEHNIHNIPTLKYMRRFLPGTDLKLNGKTLDDKDFNLESLRGKYVWIKFTGTWCGPCNLAIPGMLETYERYHGKGFEIVSIYVRQNEQDPVATVQRHVDEKKIPWIILSEEQWKQAGQPAYRDGFHPRGLPTMFLVDKEGKLMTLPTSDSGSVIAKLAEIFE